MPTLPASLPQAQIPTTQFVEASARIPAGRVVVTIGTANRIVPFSRPPSALVTVPPAAAPILAETPGLLRVAPSTVVPVLSAGVTVATELSNGASPQVALAIGAADLAGTAAGQYLGGALGSFGGPIGTFVGAGVGGYLGGFAAREIARKLLEPPQIAPPDVIVAGKPVNPSGFSIPVRLWRISAWYSYPPVEIHPGFDALLSEYSGSFGYDFGNEYGGYWVAFGIRNGKNTKAQMPHCISISVLPVPVPPVVITPPVAA